MKQTDAQFWANKEDDYLEILPVYILPDEEGQKALYPQMDQVIEKCSTVIDRHSINIKKEGDKKKREHNKWIDDNYLLIGIANYYKGQYAIAEEMFSYTAKKYKTEPSRFDAAIWLARSYVEQERYNKATTVLSIIEKDNSKDRPKDFEAKLETVQADMFLRQERIKDAIPFLENAAFLTREKKMKARLTFILGQCYEAVGRSQDAITTFEEVVKMRPEYEMEFYAKINQALAYDRRLDSEKIKSMLWAMARDEKNEEYYDQIYFALAEIEYEEQNIEKAVEYYTTSAQKSINNPRQKGRSYLRLAELYFTETEYVLAKQYYDSTATYLPENYPNYDVIVSIGNSLIGLVNNLEIVEYNDSLLALAALDEKDREKRILKMIVKLEEEEEQRKREELAALERLQNQTAINASRSKVGSGRTWYFYNSGTLGSGYQEFQRRWGGRKLEDDWRRSSKTVFADKQAAAGADSDSLPADLGQEKSNIKSLEEYLADVPLSDSAQTASHYALITALYEIGTIYKEGLKDDDNAIESFLRITNEYDTSAYALRSYYQLYIIYYEKELSGGFVGTGFKDNSEYYKNVILADYPDSEFAKLILDPDYITSKNQRYENEKAMYEETYKKYNRRQYTDVLVTCNTIITDEPDNNFISKYYLIKALTIGARKDVDSYENILREIISKFKGTPEAEKASELLGELNDAKRRLARQDDSKDLPKDTPATAPDAPSDVNTDMFNTNDESEHFFALIFAKTDGRATEIKETIADFNAEYYRNANLRITNSFIDKDHQIIIVRSFSNKAEGMDYYNTFNVNSDILSEINEKGYQKFIITTKNFTVLFRSKNADVYDVFFKTNYL
jgi:tetratricopeptide (TPR) repeat protein